MHDQIARSPAQAILAAAVEAAKSARNPEFVLDGLVLKRIRVVLGEQPVSPITPMAIAA